MFSVNNAVPTGLTPLVVNPVSSCDFYLQKNKHEEQIRHRHAKCGANVNIEKTTHLCRCDTKMHALSAVSGAFPNSLLKLGDVDRALVLDQDTPVAIGVHGLGIVLLPLCILKNE